MSSLVHRHERALGQSFADFFKERLVEEIKFVGGIWKHFKELWGQQPRLL